MLCLLMMSTHRPFRRRNDRLQKLAELLRTLEAQRPGALAEQLQVSVPTLCRDVAELQMQGLPIEGNAGTGWRFVRHAAVGPVHLSYDEVQALLVALRLAQPRLAPGMVEQAQAALERMLALLPPDKRTAIERLASSAPPEPTGAAAPDRLEMLRRAVDAHRMLRLVCQESEGRLGEQRVRPLGCECGDGAWTLLAWREDDGGFARYRVDRLERVEVLDETFEDEPGRTLADMAEQDSGRGMDQRGPPSQ